MAKNSAMMMPICPPTAPPIANNMADSTISRKKVLSVFKVRNLRISGWPLKYLIQLCT